MSIRSRESGAGPTEYRCAVACGEIGRIRHPGTAEGPNAENIAHVPTQVFNGGLPIPLQANASEQDTDEVSGRSNLSPTLSEGAQSREGENE